MGDSGARRNALYTVAGVDYPEQGRLAGVRMVGGIYVNSHRVELVAESKEQAPFVVGEKVVVTNTGEGYPHYRAMAEELKLTKWNYGSRTVEGKVYTVVSAARHPYGYGVVYAVQDDEGAQYLIGVEGLTKYVKPVAEFQIGDRVRVVATGVWSRDVAVVHGTKARNTFIDDMEQYVGQVFTIKGFGSGGYRLEGSSWSWMPQWLEAVPLTTEEKLFAAKAEIAVLKGELDIATREVVGLLEQLERVRQAAAA